MLVIVCLSVVVSYVRLVGCVSPVSPSLLYEHVFTTIFRVRYDINGPLSHFVNKVSTGGKDKLLGLAYIHTTRGFQPYKKLRMRRSSLWGKTSGKKAKILTVFCPGFTYIRLEKLTSHARGWVTQE